MSDKSAAQVIREFLCNPREYFRQKAFFELCFREIKTCLIYLRRTGYGLPLEDADLNNALNNLTCTLLVRALGEGSEDPYGRVFQWAEKFDPDTVSVDDLEYRFIGFIKNSTRQKLSRLKNENNPQIANLKKRFKKILQGPDYTFNSKNNFIAYGSAPDPADNRPMIDGQALLDLARGTFDQSLSRVKWCANIFQGLKKMPEFSPWIRMSSLIAAVVRVNSEFIEYESSAEWQFPSQGYEMLKKQAHQARERTLASLKTGKLQYFIDKGAIEPGEGSLFLKSVDMFLHDIIDDCSREKIPYYFYELMPEEKHKLYLDSYKYVFETVINTAEELFRDFMSDGLTNVQSGSYSPDRDKG